MKAVTQQSATELLRLLETKKVSPLELADEYIAQIERLNPSLNALVDFDAERVREQVRVTGKSADPRGPLFGLPFTVKSSISVAGYRCEAGSELNRGNIPVEDAELTTRLRRAGATILGTTNTPEFLMAYETDNRLYGRTNNPWNLEYTAGGSSGGESAAIAAGMAVAGFGSDGGGSVRVPAHFTGICSLKPSNGRIPGIGHIPAGVGPFAAIGVVGPMGRTMEDVSLMFEVLAGQDPREPGSPPIPHRKPTLADLKRLPVGYFEDDGVVPVTPETRQAVQDAAECLRKQGFSVRRFRPNGLEPARKLWWTLFVQCGAMLFEPMIRGQERLLSPIFREYLGFSQAVPPMTATDLLNAWAECDIIRGKVLQQMQEASVLLCPVCAIPAFRHGERKWNIEGKEVEYLDVMRYSQWFNLLGMPGAVAPVGHSPEGLPIGVQIVARPYEDEVAMAVADVVDREFGYQSPPMAVAAQAAG